MSSPTSPQRIRNTPLTRSPSDDDNDPLVIALAQDDQDKVYDLLFEEEVKPGPRALLTVMYTGYFFFLKPILYAGAPPNVRLDESQHIIPGWDQRDMDVEFTYSDSDTSSAGWYPLTLAAYAPASMAFTLSEKLVAMRELLEFGANPFAVYQDGIRRDRVYPFPGQKYNDAHDPPPSYAATGGRNAGFGLRTVVHALIEDGGPVQPFFDDQIALDLEARDPQGRTILHSICRSAKGADAPFDATWRQMHNSEVSPAATSAFHTARLRNADVLAVDSNGKNILYHLLDAHDFSSSYQPAIEDALAWTLTNCPQLVHQPDRFGTFPLHIALRRLRRRDMPRKGEAVNNLERIVEQLLEAGADPASQDSRGNIALHYLVESALTSSGGGATRTLFRRFLDAGLDVNAKNHAGMSVAALLFGAKALYGWRDSPKPSDQGCKQVLEWMDQAGAKWTEVNSNGETLFSALANGNGRHDHIYVEFLISKGMNPYARRRAAGEASGA